MDVDTSFYKNFEALTMIKKAWTLSRWRRVEFDDVYGQLQRYVCVCVSCVLFFIPTMHAFYT